MAPLFRGLFRTLLKTNGFTGVCAANPFLPNALFFIFLEKVRKPKVFSSFKRYKKRTLGKKG